MNVYTYMKYLKGNMEYFYCVFRHWVFNIMGQLLVVSSGSLQQEKIIPVSLEILEIVRSHCDIVI